MKKLDEIKWKKNKYSGGKICGEDHTENCCENCPVCVRFIPTSVRKKYLKCYDRYLMMKKLEALEEIEKI